MSYYNHISGEQNMRQRPLYSTHCTLCTLYTHPLPVISHWTGGCVDIFTLIDYSRLFRNQCQQKQAHWVNIILVERFELSLLTEQIPNFQRFSSKLLSSTMKTTLFSGRNHNRGPEQPKMAPGELDCKCQYLG